MPFSGSSRQSLPVRLLAWLYLLLVAFSVLAALYTLGVSQWRGPWRDTWEAMLFIEKALAGQAGWADYWEQYGYSHRPAVSRWLWVADLRWFAGSNGLLLAVSVLMQWLTFFSVWRVLQRESDFSAAQRGFLLVGVLFCLFNITQVFNFLHTFDVQWFLVAGFVVLSLERILASAAVHDARPLVVAWLCVLVATLNNFSALVIWPVELLLLYLLRFPRRQIAGFAVVTLCYLAFYFHDLPTGGDSLVSEVMQQGWDKKLLFLGQIFVEFPLYYLSNPLSFQLSAEGPLHMAWPITALAPTLAGLLVAGAMFDAWWRRKSFSGVAWLGVSLIVYAYGVGVVTALGRAVFWENVYALRYQNIVLLFWIGVLLWLAAAAPRRSLGLAAGAALLVVVFVLRAEWYHDLMLKTGNRTRDAHLALVVGLESHLSAIQATVSRSHLGEGSDYQLVHEAAVLRALPAGPYADPEWRVPSRTELASSVCDLPAASVDVRGDENGYARLSVDFSVPVNVGLIAWFDGEDPVPGLLIAVRADTLVERVQQSLEGFRQFAGFSRRLPAGAPDGLYAREGDTWCRLRVR